MINNDIPDSQSDHMPTAPLLTRHDSPHPRANQAVQVRFNGGHFQLPDSPPDALHDFILEDWWDHLTDTPWIMSAMDGNPAAIVYGIRLGESPTIPHDGEVVYGKIGAFGHLVHTSELVLTPARGHHLSDCAVHNEPAMPAGPCDCEPSDAEDWDKDLLEENN